MEIIILALVVGLILFLSFKKGTPALEEELSDETMEMIRESVATQDLMGEFIPFAEKHVKTLYAKERQLVFKDDYGIEDESRYDAELDYFIANVVPKRFQEGIPHSSLKYLIGIAVRRERGKQWQRERKSKQVDQIEYESNMSGLEFEQLVKSKLEEQGFIVTATPVSGDQGVDLLLASDEQVIAVQCKRSASSIGNSAVQQVVAGKAHYGADEAWVVSDAEFTAAARRLASTNDVRLVNFFIL